jgi:hypothetical protein
MRERLRQLFDQLDPMPAAIEPPMDLGWRRLEALPELTATRGHETRLSFGRGGFVIQVEIGTVLTGLVVPWIAEIEVRWPDGVTWAAVDEHGIFEVDDVPRGPVRLVIDGAATDWFVR